MIKFDKDGRIKPFKVGVLMQFIEIASAACFALSGLALLVGITNRTDRALAAVICAVGVICFLLARIAENTARTAYYTELQVRFDAKSPFDETE